MSADDNKFLPGGVDRSAGSFGAETPHREGDRNCGLPLGPKTEGGLSAKRAPYFIDPSDIRGAIICTRENFYEGALRTPELEGMFSLEPNAPSTNPNTPTHKILTDTPSGIEYRAGSAWLRPIERGPRAGQQMFSLTFQGFGGQVSLNLAAFLDAPGRDFVIVRRRRQYTGD